MSGWPGVFEKGGRPAGVHPWASVGGPPEHREWMVGDPVLVPYVNPSALVHAFCTIDAGVMGVDPRGRQRISTYVGPRTFLQARVHLGHNAYVGADCEICAGVVICGDVRIGDGVKIGGNSWVKPLVEIGDGAIIGGGSVVTKDVPAHEVWAGNPARFMKKAWTHPKVRGLRGREACAPQYDMTADQWQAAREAVMVGSPSIGEIMEYHDYTARAPVSTQESFRPADGEPIPWRPPAGPPHSDWLRGIS